MALQLNLHVRPHLEIPPILEKQNNPQKRKPKMPEFDAQKDDVLQVLSTLIGKLNLVFYIGSLI